MVANRIFQMVSVVLKFIPQLRTSMKQLINALRKVKDISKITEHFNFKITYFSSKRGKISTITYLKITQFLTRYNLKPSFPSLVGNLTHAFQACALGRYANPPVLLTRLKGIGGDD